MSVLIAGCGYVGYRVARRLVVAGNTVYAITRDPQKADCLSADGIRPVITDLGDAESAIPILPDVDALVWAVGFQRVAGQDRKTIWLDGLSRLLTGLPKRDLLMQRPRRIVYTSSTGVYGDGGGAEVDELTPAIPVTEGGRACLEAESMLRNLAEQRHVQGILLRLAGIYGPDRLLRRVTELKAATPITSPAEDWLNLVHVDDVVAVIQLMLQATEIEPMLVNGSLVMNVVAAQSVTRREYYEQLAILVDAPPPVFQTSGASPGEPSDGTRSRGRSGNRRVVSRFRGLQSQSFRFDKLADGLADAVARSSDQHSS
ncbi:MAG: NAD-dependent epimerase/dehydratase family protein [Planctomycetota bacterium]